MNRLESSEIDPYICTQLIFFSQLIFDQGTKSIQWVKKGFLTNASGTIEYFYEKNGILISSYSVCKNEYKSS